MVGLLALILVPLGLLVAIAIGSRVMVRVVPMRASQEDRFRAVARELEGHFRRSLIVADPELQLWLHGQPVLVTSSFGKRSELTRVRIDALEGCPVQGVYLELRPGEAVVHERLGPDGLEAARALADLLGQEGSVELRQRLWGEQGFIELMTGGFLSDREAAATTLARAVHLLQRIAMDPDLRSPPAG
jgi:hypothetical protein